MFPRFSETLSADMLCGEESCGKNSKSQNPNPKKIPKSKSEGKAAEKTAALHDAGARFEHLSKCAMTMAQGLDLSHDWALRTALSKASTRPLVCRRYIDA